MASQAPVVPSLTKGTIGTISFDLLSGVGGEKSAIILDIGASYTKCGFAGEATPRHVIPSDLKLKTGKKEQNIKLIRCMNHSKILNYIR